MNLLDSPSLNNFPDLKEKFKEIDEKMLKESRGKLNKENRENEKILKSVNKGYFDLRKDLLILSGTIFGSSIALSAGRSVNNIFILGEFFLFISIVAGLIMLLTYLKGEEWDYSFSSKNSLELYLILNKERIEKFELDSTESLIKDYKKLMESNQKGFMWFLLKKISIEKWPLIFNLSFLFGILLILISIIPVTPKSNQPVSLTPVQKEQITITPIPTDYFYIPQPDLSRHRDK